MSVITNTIAKKYNCQVFKDIGTDDKRSYWVALENNSDNMKFTYADGWTLQELIENIEKRISLK